MVGPGLSMDQNLPLGDVKNLDKQVDIKTCRYIISQKIVVHMHCAKALWPHVLKE